MIESLGYPCELYMRIRFNKNEIDWIERTADIETTRCFQQFNNLLPLFKNASDSGKKLLSHQIDELISLYDFLRTLRSKLELWDKRFDIDTEVEFKEASSTKTESEDKT
jgi:hypothetical protein